MTLPIQKGTNVFIKRKGDNSIKTPEDMEGKSRGNTDIMFITRQIQRHLIKTYIKRWKGI